MVATDRLITLSVLFGSLSWYAWTLGRGLAREVEPLRRRDLTMAGAGDVGAIRGRLAKTRVKATMPLLVVFALGFVACLALTFSVERRPNLLLVGIFHGCVALLPALPVCGGVLAALAERACRQNRPLWVLAWPVAVLASAPTALLAPLGGMIFFGLITAARDAFGETSAILGGALSVAVLILGGLALVVGLPDYAWTRFHRAYPYHER